MAKSSSSGDEADLLPSDAPRIPRTISLRADQDRWLTELLGERGNLSAFMQALIDLAVRGEIDTRKLLKGQKNVDALSRAATYLKAKEAGMLFEEDVGATVTKWLGGKRGYRVGRSRIHNGSGTSFIADFSIEREGGEVVASIVCKSSPRGDRLQLALAEAMIGQQKTQRPVITVVPYFIEEGAASAEQFKLLDYKLTDLKGLPATLDKVARG